MDKFMIKYMIMMLFVIIMLMITRTHGISKQKFKNVTDSDMKKFVNFVECNIPYGKKGCDTKLTKYYTLDIDGDNVVLVPPPEEENESVEKN